MQFTVDDVVYSGFQSASRQNSIKPDNILVIAWFDGEPELWVVENATGVENLRQMYHNTWGDRDIPMTFARVHEAGWFTKGPFESTKAISSSLEPFLKNLFNKKV